MTLIPCPADAGDPGWPGWRGPNRDGVAPDSPPLVEGFGEGGLRRVWESEPIPGAHLGGFSQVSVAGGRVFVLVHERLETAFKQRVLSRDVLTRLGWFPDMPEELVKAVEDARTSETRAKLKDGKEILTWADEWIRTRFKPEWGKFQQAMRMRLALGRQILPLDLLAKLEPVVDKEFPGEAELDAFLNEQGFDPEARKQVLKLVPKTRRSAVDRVHALDRATGKELWKKEFPGNWMLSPDSSTPCVKDDRCYFFGSTGIAYCLDVKDGNLLWQSKLLVSVVQQHSRSSSPLVLPATPTDLVVICTDEALQAIDLKTGRVVWTNAEVQNRESSAVVWRSEGKDCLLCAGTGKVFCLEASSGRTLWTVPSGESASTPAVSGDIMVFCGGRKDVGLVAYRLPQAGAKDASPVQLWNVPFIDRFTSAVIFRNHVYAVGGGSGVLEFGVKDKGRALCVELETGKVVWDELIGAGAEFSSPVIADGKLIVEVGSWLYLIRASAEPGNATPLLGKTDLGLPRWISPAFADGHVFLRTLKAVVCYDLKRQP